MTTAIIEKKESDKFELLSPSEYTKAQGVTQADYARHRKITRQMVHKYISQGKIIKMDNENIDVEASDERLDDLLDPSFTGNADEQRGVKKEDASMGSCPASFAERKLYRLGLQIQLEEIELKKERGKYIDKKKADSAFASKIISVMRRLQKIPKRISPTVAQETDRIKCEGIILNEIMEAVEEFGQT